MKKNILVIILMMIVNSLSAQSNYYWYKGEKVNIIINKDLFYISSPDSVELSGPSLFPSIRIVSVKDRGNYIDINSKKRYWRIVELKNVNTNASPNLNTIYSYAHPSQIYVAPVIGNTKPTATTEYFYVKVKVPSDSTILFETAKNMSCEMLNNIEFMPLWYKLKAPITSNGLNMANAFYETNKFEEVDPSFMFNFQPIEWPPNDPLFSQQWALNNNYLNGVNIKALDAWSISKGSGITIAIIDQGIDLSDKEFVYTIGRSYDLINNTSPSQVYGAHGTHVAGIAGANQNNYIQISGVAPNATLMSISHPLTMRPNVSAELANGITYAWQQGASVINCSWGDQGGALYNNLHSAVLDNAISTAISFGRGGLGTIMVFAAGNFAPVMDYPANSNPDIEAVGAVDSMGHRASFSGYGNSLDVVAPGVDILSTVPNNGVARMSGTSMAAPHVAGIAALILSVDPNLTGKQVRDIVESTAQKVGGYSYNQNKPNGTWNNEMGYGLVNAYAAVQAALPCSTIIDYSNQAVSTNASVNGCYVTSHNVTVTGGKLTITSTILTTITPTLTVNAGTELQLGN